MNSPHEIGKSLFQMARLCAARGDSSQMQEKLAQAASIFESLGARLDLARGTMDALDAWAADGMDFELHADGELRTYPASNLILPGITRDVVLEVEHVSKGYGERLLFEGLSFDLPQGTLTAILGREAAYTGASRARPTGRPCASSGAARCASPERTQARPAYSQLSARSG